MGEEGKERGEEMTYRERLMRIKNDQLKLNSSRLNLDLNCPCDVHLFHDKYFTKEGERVESKGKYRKKSAREWRAGESTGRTGESGEQGESTGRRDREWGAREEYRKKGEKKNETQG